VKNDYFSLARTVDVLNIYPTEQPKPDVCNAENICCSCQLSAQCYSNRLTYFCFPFVKL